LDELSPTRIIEMRNERPDGQTLQQLLERTLERSLGGGAAAAPGLGGSGSPVVVGEVLDTHDPEQHHRVYVRWFASVDIEQRAWLQHERRLELQQGDRVLVTLPLGWAEWLVTGVLAAIPGGTAPEATPQGAAPSATPEHAADGGGAPRSVVRPAPSGASAAPAELQLAPGQCLVILGGGGEPLLSIQQGPEGPIVAFAHDQVELEARGRLRLSGERIELVAGAGGVEIGTQGDAVVRGKVIRLN
jgi:hypothetical protein